MYVHGRSGREAQRTNSDESQQDQNPRAIAKNTKKKELTIELNIVLLEPQIPQNAGNIARTCAATGARLHLVEPLGFTVTDKQLKRAGLDYWKFLDITYYKDWADFTAKNDGTFFYFTTKGQNVFTDVSYPDKSYLVFGREDKGLPEELLYINKKSCVRLPMIGEARSLNLSNTVAVAAYEALRQWGYPELKNYGSLTKFDWSTIE